MNIEDLIKKWEGKEPKNVVSLGKYPVAFPGLTLFHGLSGSLKSFSSVIIASKLDYDYRFYLDFEGNSVDLKTHCLKHNVNYLNLAYGGKQELRMFLTDIAKFSEKNKILVIVDSFSRVFTEPVNETHKIDSVFKELKYLCTDNNYSLLIIDHSRKLEFGGIDIRGGDNKKKFADVVISSNNADLKTFTANIELEKSRLSAFTVGSKFSIKTSTKELKQEFIDLIKQKNIKSKAEAYKRLSKKQREVYTEYIKEFDQIIGEIKW